MNRQSLFGRAGSSGPGKGYWFGAGRKRKTPALSPVLATGPGSVPNLVSVNPMYNLNPSQETVAEKKRTLNLSPGSLSLRW